MPLSWNEIKSRALAFSKHWADAGNEDAEAKPFLIAFFEIFGITNKRVASFEHAVKKHGGGSGYVDLFWPGILLVEMKSRGRNLDRAYTQAMDYFPGIAERDLPRYVLVCDFARFRLHDLSDGSVHEFPLAELYKNVRLFGFIAGYQTQVIKPQDPINIKAAERMGRLHDQLKAIGYDGRPLELYLVRLLFCLFAEDTSLFEKRQFQDYVEQRTSADGSDLAHHLTTLFHVLNTPYEKRLKNLDEELADFPYINGRLFEEMLPPASFDAAMRESLLDLCGLDWSRISPAIFGSLFQSIMDDTARRNLGAHYTSEENILKLIKPLFLDALWAEFEKIRHNKNKLFEFHKRLRTLTFFDPACGCGNFLVITYRELRLLELEVLRAAHTSGQQMLDIHQLISVDVDQFYGIEIEEFPAQIAQVALWLTDHQMNLKVSEEFGAYFARIPLTHSATIVHDNALRIAWADVLAPERCSYILGNPPFVGAKYMNDAQREDTRQVFGDIENAGLLDLVAAWYVKAARYMHSLPSPSGRGAGGEGSSIRAAFVSTNSITQGEQVGALWGWLLAQGIKIHFAHRTFAWSNEARGKAAVHCVIVGFGLEDVADKTIFEYEDIRGEAHAVKAANINPYLVDAPDIILPRRTRPISQIQEIGIGSQPIDDGNFLFTTEEKDEFLRIEPAAEKYFHRWLGSVEFINGYERWALWLGDCPPQELRQLPESMKRVDAVRKFRLASKRKQTVAAASSPTHFGTELIPTQPYLLIPKVSSEKRRFIPIGFIEPTTFCSDLVFMMPNASLFDFGILTATMHNAWVRSVCGRLKSDYRYSASIVYNNFPWPFSLTPTLSLGEREQKQRAVIEAAAQGVLDARSAHAGASLADLYDPLTMPPDLLKAHQKLDAAVDAAYGFKGGNDAARVAFLFGLYQQLVAALPAEKPKARRKKTAQEE
ncbi:MAG: DNA methyltransferase [Pseudomonadota bacterium]